MITVLTGENSFGINYALQEIISEFTGVVERFDGSELEIRQLPDLLVGVTLFADQRLVIIKNLSENRFVWTNFADWIPRISDHIHVVLIEPKLDKQSKVYKGLQKDAQFQDFKLWNERDITSAEGWIINEARRQNFNLDREAIRTLIARVGLDQWSLYHALEKLSVLNDITPGIITEVIDTVPNENVFGLFEASLHGDIKKVGYMIANLKLTDDPYMVFGLLSSQVFQMAMLAVADISQLKVSKDIGVHPFVLSKLAPYAKHLGKLGTGKIVTIFAETDKSLKLSNSEPWLLIERALIKTARLV